MHVFLDVSLGVGSQMTQMSRDRIKNKLQNMINKLLLFSFICHFMDFKEIWSLPNSDLKFICSYFSHEYSRNKLIKYTRAVFISQ